MTTQGGAPCKRAAYFYMTTITKTRIEEALKKATEHASTVLGVEVEIYDYELKFDREWGLVTAQVVFSNGDMEDIPINYRTT